MVLGSSHDRTSHQSNRGGGWYGEVGDGESFYRLVIGCYWCDFGDQYCLNLNDRLPLEKIQQTIKLDERSLQMMAVNQHGVMS